MVNIDQINLTSFEDLTCARGLHADSCALHGRCLQCANIMQHRLHAVLCAHAAALHFDVPVPVLVDCIPLKFHTNARQQASSSGALDLSQVNAQVRAP
jgi:hypothetical protein